jgi:hypothetical protein
MATTSRGQRWEISHSLWIGWTFTLGFFNWVAFFYIGIRAKHRRWLLWGLFYAIPFILAMATADRPAFDGWVGDLVVVLTLVLGVISIIHAFRVRKEYLLRLEALQRGVPERDAALRDRVDAEFAGQRRAPDGRRAAEPLPTDRTRNAEQESTGVAPNQPARPTSSAGPQASGVDLNNAPEQQLASLPGVGLIVAKRAVGLRGSRGGFRSVELLAVAKPQVVPESRL